MLNSTNQIVGLNNSSGSRKVSIGDLTRRDGQQSTISPDKMIPIEQIPVKDIVVKTRFFNPTQLKLNSKLNELRELGRALAQASLIA